MIDRLEVSETKPLHLFTRDSRWLDSPDINGPPQAAWTFTIIISWISSFSLFKYLIILSIHF